MVWQIYRSIHFLKTSLNEDQALQYRISCHVNIIKQERQECFYMYVNTSRSFPHSLLITGFVTRLIRPTSATSGAETAYPSGAHEFSPDFSGVRITRSWVLCVFFIDRCWFFCPFSVDHCVVCSSSIYRFLLPLWYLKTLLTVPGSCIFLYV